MSRGARVELVSLSKTFGRVVAVDRVSLVVEPGEFLTLLGPSGSGKTTTLMLVAGFETPSAGTIAIGGQDVSQMPPYRRHLGMVFQHYALFPHMTVYDNVAFPLETRGVDGAETRRQVQMALDRVQLTGYDRRLPRQLSGGQQQRVALARAIVYNPPVLLMDEPLGALDRKLREQMQLEIRRLQRALRITVLYVTHDQEEALTMSDRIAVMNHGRIVQVGAPEDVYERPASRFVAEFIGESNLLEGRVRHCGTPWTEMVTSDGLEVLLIPETTLTPGTPVTVALRPERITLNPKEERARRGSDLADLTRWPAGVIEEVVYVGETRRYRLRVRDQVVIARQPTGADVEHFEVGDRVVVAWDPRDVRVVGWRREDVGSSN